MAYHISKFVEGDFRAVRGRVIEELKKEGFGIITEIDVKDTMKKKLGAEFREYVILGACNPGFAHEALTLEDKVGVYLPCNVVVQQWEDGRVEVSAMNPLVAMAGIQNPAMEGLAQQVTAAMERFICAL